MKPMTDKEFANVCESFARYADIEDARIVCEVLTENIAVLTQIADMAERKGSDGYAKHIRSLIKIDDHLKAALTRQFDALQEQEVAQAQEDAE